MELDVFDSLKQGFRDVSSRKGVLSVLLFFISYLILEVIFRSYSVAGYESTQYKNIDPSGTYLFSNGPIVETVINVAEPHLGLLLGLSLFIPLVPTMMSFRGFNGRNMLPESAGEFGRIVFYLLLVNLIAFLGILTGSIFFLLPGVYLALALLFFPIFICAEGEGIESLKSSWKLTKRNKTRIFGLLIILFLITLIPSLAVEFYKMEFTAVFISSIETVLGIATISAAYRQLRGEKE